MSEKKSRIVDDDEEGIKDLRIWRGGKQIYGPSGPLAPAMPEGKETK